MALQLVGEPSSVQVRLKTIVYAPTVVNSGDLEPGTKSITATAKAGMGDYTSTHTLPTPADARLRVLRTCLRVQVTVDSFDGAPAATQLSYSVHVNGVERMTGSWTATGAQLATVDLPEGQFYLGSANTIDLYLWVNQGGASVSLAQTWMGVGTKSTSFTAANVLQLLHTGGAALSAYTRRLGTGSPTLLLAQPEVNWLELLNASGDGAKLKSENALLNNSVLSMFGTVATDLNYVDTVVISLRSIQ